MSFLVRIDIPKEKIQTFACDGFWSCADRDDAWVRALRFLDRIDIPKEKRQTFSCGGFWSLATPTLDEEGVKTLVQWEASTTFLEQYVDVAVRHTISNGGFFTKLQDDNPDDSNIICHHLIRRKLFVLFKFGRSGRYSRPASPPYLYWCNKGRSRCYDILSRFVTRIQPPLGTMLWDLSIDPEVNMDEFVNHKLVRDYMNHDPEHSQCVRRYILPLLQKTEKKKVTVTEVTPRTEVEPSRSGDRQERDELLRVLAESARDVTPKYF